MRVDRTVNAPVYAATENDDGALVLTVTAAGGDRTVDRVIKPVAEAQTQKAPTHPLADRVGRIIVPLVLAEDAGCVVVSPPHATVGIAMGGAGTAAALETAGVALMGDDLGPLRFALGLSVMLHEASTLTVVANGLCLLAYHERGTGGEGRCGFAVVSCGAPTDRGSARVEGETPCPLWQGPVGRVMRRGAD